MPSLVQDTDKLLEAMKPVLFPSVPLFANNKLLVRVEQLFSVYNKQLGWLKPGVRTSSVNETKSGRDISVNEVTLEKSDSLPNIMTPQKIIR